MRYILSLLASSYSRRVSAAYLVLAYKEGVSYISVFTVSNFFDAPICRPIDFKRLGRCKMAINGSGTV
jgi:hypothetical protein